MVLERRVGSARPYRLRLGVSIYQRWLRIKNLPEQSQDLPLQGGRFIKTRTPFLRGLVV